MTYRKKLIEVALPLEAINIASAREKSIRHGHPSTLHLWWARRPLAAARAVIFSQMVDDPSEHVDELLADPGMRKKAEKMFRERKKVWDERKADIDRARKAGVEQLPELGPEPKLEEVIAEQERERLFGIIEELVLWENTTNEEVLQRARDEIWKSWRRTCEENKNHAQAKEIFDPEKLPAFHDPFAGGGSLPLEAQRLGLEAYASDLNPVAVLICKAMIEIPPKFAGRPPVNPEARKEQRLLKKEWRGAEGLAEDVRYYGQWMRDEAEKRIGHLYPKIEITAEMAKDRPDLKPYVGRTLTVIAWLWARTVKSPNPAFAQVDVPLASTFMLSTKAGKQAYVEPMIEKGDYRFTVKVGRPKDADAAKNGTKLARANFVCLMSGAPIAGDYIKAEGKAGRMGARLMAIVAEGEHGRVYLAPTPEHAAAVFTARPEWKPELTISGSTQYLGVKPYGMDRFDQLFTDRQLVALTVFSDLVQEARERVKRDARDAGMPDHGTSLRDGGTSAAPYADSVAVYLSFAVSRGADKWASLAVWNVVGEKIEHVFGRQAIPMTWDYAEGNPFSGSTGNWVSAIAWGERFLRLHGLGLAGRASLADAQTQTVTRGKIVSTDPPYYDNVPYADLSDFFYVWLRRSLRAVFPELFATLAAPKAEELVAFAYRHDDKAAAEAFFLDGMTRAMHRLAEQVHPAFPITIYYAFKQAESDDEGTASTGWDTFLEAIIKAGFAVTGTWPMRTERQGRLRETGSNALASSVVLVCRPGSAGARTATRREFIATLKAELPQALAHLQRSNIAPVDLAQAAIGPGMAIYTRYARVLHTEGKALSVRDALGLINQILDEALAEQEGDFDADTRWALAWFDQDGFGESEFGVAETLSKAKNTSIQGMSDAGILESTRGKVRLLRPEELPADWDPATDPRLTAWEVVHHLIRALETSEGAVAELVAKLGSKAEVARELAYRLYVLCERKKWTSEALAYNGLVQSWPEITRLARERERPKQVQPPLFGQE